MPCSGDNYPSDNEISAKKLQANRVDRENAKARKLLDWLSRHTITEPTDDVGRLCKLITGMGEDQFLNIVKREFDNPVARQLAGWWEDHKELDTLRDRGE